MLAPDVGVVVAYGHILKPELLALPGHGMVNVHPSLLPELRGAAPVEWAILNGLEKTGVTIMRMDEGLDSGPILHQLPHYIEPEVTGGELSEHLAEMGAQALVETLALLEQDALKPVPQDHARATYAPKLTRDTARIRWSEPADKVARTIRALDPKPGAGTALETGKGKREPLKGSRRVAGNVEVKLFGAKPVEGAGTPGEVLTANGRLLIAAGAGGVEVEEVQPAGKPRMSAADWLRGRGVAAGGRFALSRRFRGCMRSPTSASRAGPALASSRAPSPPGGGRA